MRHYKGARERHSSGLCRMIVAINFALLRKKNSALFPVYYEAPKLIAD